MVSIDPAWAGFVGQEKPTVETTPSVATRPPLHAQQPTDGYIEDKTGAFDWGNPDQILDFITELMRPIGTHLLGRRLYETMAHWDGPLEGYPPEHRDFARVWQKAEQIVFSRTLTRAPTRIARVEREFDPEATRKLKREAARGEAACTSAKRKGRGMNPGLLHFNPGDDLLSHAVASAVPSALEGLTSVFGMGTGVAPPV